jgi:hypothetical protein
MLADRYELGALIGRGGAANVYRGWDLSLERSVAIKVVPADVDPTGLDRRQSEAKLLASLNQASLVTLYDAIVAADATYLVMELMEGGTLAGLIGRGPVAPDAVARVAAAIADGLAYIHARGIVHRDVKPANVLLADGTPLVAKLSDFGIAKLLQTAPGRTTGVIGTAQYLSPEQARGERLAPASDVYSLGLTLIESLTGAPVFAGGLAESLVARMLRDPEVPRSLGYEWRSLLTAMTARDPAARPSAQVVARQARLLDVGPVTGDLATAVLETAPIGVQAAPALPTPTPTTPIPGGAIAERGASGRPARRRIRIGIAGLVGAVVGAGDPVGALGPQVGDRSAQVAASPSATARVDSSGAPTPAASTVSQSPPATSATVVRVAAPATAATGRSAGPGPGKARSAAHGKPKGGGKHGR